MVRGQEHGQELRKERSPEWQQENNGSQNQRHERDGRPVQGLGSTMQENRSHYDMADERLHQAGSRPHTSGEPSAREWRQDQSAYQVSTLDFESRSNSYQRTQQIISQAARRPLEVSPPPAPPPKDGFSYVRQNSMPVGNLRTKEVIPPLPFSQDEDWGYSRQNMQLGNQQRQHELVSPPAVPLPNDAHLVYSRQPPMQLGNQQGLRSLSQGSLQTPARQGKNKFHLLNPMSLLSRRRNGQELEQLSEESLVSTRNPSVSPLPDGYDPSIRGKVVHDFSAPRTRRNFSSPGPSTNMDASEARGLSSSEGHAPNRPRKGSDDTLNVRHERQSQHTPVFKEHFDDDPDETTNASAIHAESLANKDFLARNSFPTPEQETVSPLSPLPPFARTAKTVYKPRQQEQLQSQPQVQPQPSTLAPPVQPHEAYVGLSATNGPLSPLMEDPISPLEEGTPKDNSKDNSNVNTTARNVSLKKPPTSRSRVGSRTSFGSDFQPAGLPSHMLSRASRFSFQYANTDSAAQEMLLEEKHRQKAAAKAAADLNREAEEDQSEEEEDEMDYDDMDYDDMDGDVPMVGEDWDYGGGGLGGIGNMTLNSLPMNGVMGGMNGLSMQEAAHMALRGNPIDDGDLADGEDEEDGEEKHEGLGGMSFDDMPTGEVQGLGILPSTKGEEPELVSPLDELEVKQNLRGGDDEPMKDSVMAQDDNFYFDDGEFDDADFVDTDTQKFDESVLDDPSHPLYERQSVGAPPPIPAKSLRRVVPQNSQKLPGQRRSLPSEPVPALPEHPDPSASMDIISKYQSALAMAATKAAAEGRFARKDSMENSSSDISVHPNETHDEEEGEDSSRPSLVPDDGRFSQATTTSPPTARASEIQNNLYETPSKSVGFSFPGAYNEDLYSSDFEYSDYDSMMEDDPYIAAANAEALANDDEGIYGTEFGFYARPGSTDASATDAEGNSVYGGYFGPKNWGEIKRQRSTREPNLTPITERSEYSTRNSYISLQHGDRGAAPSPSLNALAQMSPGWESDMNIETLMKLRRGAWGGSQRSNTSSRGGGGEGSSPMNSSPIAAKGDPRALWSSPIRQEVPEQDAGNEEGREGEGYYEDYLDDANYEQEESEYQGKGYEDEWEDASNEGSESIYGDEGEDVDSPTIRANPYQHLGETPSPDDSTSPTLPPAQGQASTHQEQQNLVQLITPASPSTASTTSTSQTMQQGTSSFTTSSRPNSLGPTSPTSPAPPHKGHSRSGSDSVAYVRERDEDGGEFRWFLERRRTGSDGVESLVGRTLVEGGRI
jgi:hypothetical protein